MIPVEILRQVRRLQLRARRAVNSLVAGEYHSAFKGSGLNFDEVREYIPGDDVRRIDWNVTARTGRPFLKRFVEERELTILLAVDLSASLAFGSTATTKRTIVAEIAALLAFAALQNGDRVGFLGFTSRIEAYRPPRRGSRHIVRCLRDILAAETHYPGTDLPEALREIHRIQRRRAVVFLLSDFQDDCSDSDLRRVAARHDLVAVRIVDPRELDWPNFGTIRVADPETGTVRFASSQSLQAATKQFQDRRTTFDLAARTAGIDVIDVTTAGGHFDAVIRFLRQRGRR